MAILLEIQPLAARILACAGPFNQETIFDSFEETRPQIIALASRLLITGACKNSAEKEPSPFPAFDIGILSHLYLVTSRCRHLWLRRQALHLLRRGPSQEGIWNKDMLCNIRERIMNMEVRGSRRPQSSGNIPLGTRLSVINATIDMARRTVMLHCCGQDSGEEGIREVLHELVEY